MDQLARLLVLAGAGPESVVAVLMERSAGLVAALLAVLKAGAAYLLVDSDYPAGRIAFMLVDAGPAVIVATEAAAGAVPAGVGAPMLVVDGPGYAAWLAAAGGADAADAGRAVPLRASHAAYVIYTSGSTGVPKGVVVPHAGVGSLVEGHRRLLGAGPGCRVAQFASPGFDTFGWEWTMALLTGAALAVCRPGGGWGRRWQGSWPRRGSRM